MTLVGSRQLAARNAVETQQLGEKRSAVLEDAIARQSLVRHPDGLRLRAKAVASWSLFCPFGLSLTVMS